MGFRLQILIKMKTLILLMSIALVQQEVGTASVANAGPCVLPDPCPEPPIIRLPLPRPDPQPTTQFITRKKREAVADAVQCGHHGSCTHPPRLVHSQNNSGKPKIVIIDKREAAAELLELLVG